MHTTRGVLSLIAVLLPALAGLQGCTDSGGTPTPAVAPRPVTWSHAVVGLPPSAALTAGTVDAWKQERLSFEVGGRVAYVGEPGSEVRGSVRDLEGVTLSGTLLARLDDERYDIRVSGADADVAGARAEAQALRASLEQGLPSQRREVQATYDNAKAEFERQQRLLKQGAGAQGFVDRARAAFRAAEAKLAQLDAQQRELTSRLASLRARIGESEQSLREARVNLSDTELYSPFNGEIARVHAIPGGYVEPGQPVVTVQMMDPVKVEIAVPATLDRKIHFNDLLRVHVDGAPEPLSGWVWHKDPVADSATRTFMITLLVRNRRLHADAARVADTEGIGTTVDALWNLESEFDDGQPPFYVNSRALHTDAQGDYVWMAENLQVQDLSRTFDPVFTVRRVGVTAGARERGFVGILSYRELRDTGTLDPRSSLVIGTASGPLADGTRVRLARSQWQLRPGQLVRVDLGARDLQPGTWVPLDAIVRDPDGQSRVFVVEADADGKQLASSIAVRTAEASGGLQRVEAIDGAIPATARIIVEGAHYLRDSQAVSAFAQSEAVQ